MTGVAGTVQRSAHADVAGPLNAPPIVFLHGSVVTRAIWRPQLIALSDSYRTIAPDLPGHGSEAHLPFTFDRAVAHVAATIRAEAGGRAVLVGLSLGGYVAIETAVRLPELVSGLVICGTTVNFTGALGVYLKTVAWLMNAGVLRPSRSKLEARTRRLFPPALADVADLQIRDGVFPADLGPAFAEMAGRDFARRLADARCPVLILNGERDKPARRGEAAFVAALGKRGRVATVPGAGHACNLAQPEAFTRAVREFLQTLEQPDRDPIQ